MLAIDDKNFPDYAYCPVNESRKHRKDAKIQFVALIVNKPEVGPDQRLQWKVVDRTGEVCVAFSFQTPLVQKSFHHAFCKWGPTVADDAIL